MNNIKHVPLVVDKDGFAGYEGTAVGWKFKGEQVIVIAKDSAALDRAMVAFGQTEKVNHKQTQQVRMNAQVPKPITDKMIDEQLRNLIGDLIEDLVDGGDHDMLRDAAIRRIRQLGLASTKPVEQTKAVAYVLAAPTWATKVHDTDRAIMRRLV